MSIIRRSIFRQLVPLLSVASIIAANATADTRQSCRHTPYARADVGYSSMPERLNKEFYSSRTSGAFVGAMGLGYAINSKFRTDVSLSYRGEYRYSSTEQAGRRISQKVSSASLMLSGYWSPMANVFQYVSPYLMGGAGLAVNKAGTYGNSQDYVLGTKTGQFAWQIGAGLLHKANDRVSVDLMYKYVDLGMIRTRDIMHRGATLKASDGITGKLKAHEITIGIGFNFI
jgi:opacity protein-like surface antigen